MLKKTFLILIFGFWANFSFSQEIQSIYKFKIGKMKKNFFHYELDSLVLYKNGDFTQNYLYKYHEINTAYYKGNWKIEDGILILNVKQERDFFDKEVWNNSFEVYRYLIKRKKLIPIETIITYENKKISFQPPRKLKLLSK